jgi:hypothetical protein
LWSPDHSLRNIAQHRTACDLSRVNFLVIETNCFYFSETRAHTITCMMMTMINTLTRTSGSCPVAVSVQCDIADLNLMESIPLCLNYYSHRYRLYRLTQKFCCLSFKCLLVSIEDDHHRAFFYKTFKIKIKCLRI